MKKIAILIAMTLRLGHAAAPVVTKVEPPDWPVEPQGITLRILIDGHDLTGAKVHAAFATGPVKISASGTHLFFDLTLPKSVPPGKYPISITTAEGTAQAPFSVAAALPTAGRFQGFDSNDIFYLIMPDRFANGDSSNDDPAVSRGLFDRSKSRYYHGGDFAGIEQHLPYLKALGVTTLWLTPIYDNANHLNERERYDNQAITDYHGYGAVDFYAVEEHFGTLDKFRELVDQAHQHGLKMVQDEVANHTGPYHPWVQDPPTPTWFNGTEAQHLSNTWRTWTLIDPHAPPELQKSTVEGWFAGILPDLNQNDPEVARYLIQNTLWWIGRTGIDGIRQDTLPYVPRTFWRQWTAAIHHRYPNFRVVGEVFDSDPGLVSFFQGGKPRFDGIDTGVDSVFDFPLQAVIGKVFTEAAPTRELSQTLAHDWLYPDANRLVTFTDLHDLPRFMSEHDATYNALERLFAFLMTERGIPMVYYGDEIGMKGGNDPDNRRDFPGGWQGDAQNAFEASGRTKDQQALFESLRKLTHLRAQSEALRRGKTVDLLAEDRAYAFARITPSERVLVIFNNAATPASLHVTVGDAGILDGAELQDGYGSAPAVTVKQHAIDVQLPGHSVAIYRQ
ncbi:MAG TPA: alpha-amylase family glycosyl hydrolase [Bryobacteraceae bacterium]|nr:alpha-amylase family glycosyl hydrolase [Bryobacteraceae bacterium]